MFGLYFPIDRQWTPPPPPVPTQYCSFANPRPITYNTPSWTSTTEEATFKDWSKSKTILVKQKYFFVKINDLFLWGFWQFLKFFYKKCPVKIYYTWFECERVGQSVKFTSCLYTVNRVKKLCLFSANISLQSSIFRFVYLPGFSQSQW